MKIAIIPPTTYTGEGRYGEYLIKGLMNRGINIEILNNPLLVNRPNTKVFLGSIFLKNILSEMDVSIVHSVENLAPFLIRESNKQIKYVMSIHDISPVIFPNLYKWIVRFDYTKILPILAKNCDFVLASSHSTKKDLISYLGIDKNKIDVVHLGIDTSFFYPTFSKFILEKHGINHDYLLYVGDDNPRKNLINLIIAYSEIFDEINHDLVLIGPINQNKLIKFIKQIIMPHNLDDFLKRIIMPGYVNKEDLPVIYSSASTLIFPSLYEGFGFTPLESMACGTPLIISDNSSLREVVGNAGLYIKDPLNPNEISKSILRLLADEKLIRKLKSRGLVQANKFTWQETIDKTFKLYNKLL